MKMINAPAVTWKYWAMLCFASVLGADLGDLLSRELGLGYWRGLPVLGAAFALVVFCARRMPRSAGWYWLSIVIVRAAATNLADWQALNEGEPPTLRFDAAFPVIIAGWGLFVILLALRDRQKCQDRVGGVTDLWFWLTMLAVGTLGTAIGDWLAFVSGVGLEVATAATTLLLIVALAALTSIRRRGMFAFWALVLVVRTWGTNVGDLSTYEAGSWLPFVVAVLLNVLVFAALYRRGLSADSKRLTSR